MCPEFSDNDVGKTVKNTEGMAVGLVAAVDGDTAFVEPNPGVTDSIMAMLGQENDEEDTVPITEDDVREITDDSIHLAADRSDDGDGHDSIAEQHEGSGERDASPTTGGDVEARNESEGDSGPERPPEGDRTVTEDRGKERDR